jgi:catechol 2,3-dioxygenase-like lactoylglutathione lyase family enzyme
MNMGQKLAMIALVVRDYDEAIDFFTRKLNFILLEDTKMSETKRWVRVQPPAGGCELLLAKAANEHQASRVGDQTGGRVFFFLHTDDFDRDYRNLIDQGIRIVREPSVESYGTVCVFADLYGNLWDLIGR